MKALVKHHPEQDKLHQLEDTWRSDAAADSLSYSKNDCGEGRECEEEHFETFISPLNPSIKQD